MDAEQQSIDHHERKRLGAESLVAMYYGMSVEELRELLSEITKTTQKTTPSIQEPESL